MNYRHILLLSGILALASLFVPFVWLEIGPGGYKVYGPNVPHVYIYGGLITGKDLGFWGISCAMIFQIVGFLFFALLSAAAYSSREESRTIYFLFCQSVMLALFPFWLKGYVGGVIGNSDGADLSVHWQFGIVLYVLLIVLNSIALVWGICRTIKQNR